MRDRLIGFLRITQTSLRAEDHAMKGKTIAELEMQFTALAQLKGGHQQLLLGLADGCLKRGLPGFEASPGSIDLSRPETPFLADHQDFSLFPDKAKGGPHGGLPAFPEGGVLGIHGEGINLENRK